MAVALETAMRTEIAMCADPSPLEWPSIRKEEEPCTPALTHTSSLDTDLTRNTRAPHFTPKHWLLCHMGLH